eukprot:gnl/TRDRNA2_/TRDRNA2_111564_c0_seq1.p1 gnl/TRDRNA2_/TRDRNA2_111564_c0~~gnl/TRDRNA2_/TRDRNA2_111564_c0_seq1.p1  ORF type:complete len:294 (+),score=67.33 gnl/TRDRNA2_/TRDRNA2_111564_c0_seq1:65-946(+)
MRQSYDLLWIIVLSLRLRETDWSSEIVDDDTDDNSEEELLSWMHEHRRGIKQHQEMELPKKDEKKEVGPYSRDEELLQLIREKAKKGDAEAQFNYGVFWATGRGGLKADDTEALKWYKKAAEQGDTDAQYNVAKFYEKGRGGLAQSFVMAAQWYRKAAAQGNTAAAFNLANSIRRGHAFAGQSIPKSLDDEGTQMYTMAAEKGHAKAQFQVGFEHESGFYRDKSDKKAAEWYLKSAKQGFDEAQFRLSEFYWKGRGGLPKDKAKAIELRQKAADQGHIEARRQIEAKESRRKN